VDIASDVDAAQKIVMDVLENDKRILKMPPPQTGIAALKEYTIDVLVRGWVMNADGEATLFDIQQRIKERFDAAHILPPARRQTTVSLDTASAKPAVRRAG